MFQRKKPSRKDIVVLTLIPIISAIVSLSLKTSFFESTLLFFGLPAAYLAIVNPKPVKKIMLFSALWALPAGFLIDILADVNKSWYVPNTQTVYRILGSVPVEDLVWAFLLTFMVLAYYEYLFDKHTFLQRSLDKVFRKKRLKEDLKLVGAFDLGILLIAMILGVALEFRVPFFYLFGGIALALIPLWAFLQIHPKFTSTFVKLTLILLPQFLLFELVGLKLGQWEFLGTEFIGWVELLGHRFPVEEFVVWFLLMAPAIVVWFEFLVDDKK